MLRKMYKRMESNTRTNSEVNNSRSSSKNDFWIKEHDRATNKRIELERNKKLENEAQDMLSNCNQIYQEWTKNGKRLYQCSDDISLPSIKQFIALSIKYGILEIKEQELEDNRNDLTSGTAENGLEYKLKKINEHINNTRAEMKKTFEYLGKNDLISEPNCEKWFKRYRKDGNELDPHYRDETYKSILERLRRGENHIIKLQQAAMNIGKYQKLLEKTGDETYIEYINNYQNQFDNIISSTYTNLTGRHLAEENNKYTSPWLLENDTVSERPNVETSQTDLRNPLGQPENRKNPENTSQHNQIGRESPIDPDLKRTLLANSKTGR